jgi:hypothetical protein
MKHCLLFLCLFNKSVSTKYVIWRRVRYKYRSMKQKCRGLFKVLLMCRGKGIHKTWQVVSLHKLKVT